MRTEQTRKTASPPPQDSRHTNSSQNTSTEQKNPFHSSPSQIERQERIAQLVEKARLLNLDGKQELQKQIMIANMIRGIHPYLSPQTVDSYILTILTILGAETKLE